MNAYKCNKCSKKTYRKDCCIMKKENQEKETIKDFNCFNVKFSDSPKRCMIQCELCKPKNI
jgi:hypothetical protein